MKKNRIIAGAAAAALLVGSLSFAYFTDRAESTFAGKAGNLCLTEVNTEADLLNLAPGDTRDVKFSYKNEGTLSLDTRITYIVNHEVNEEQLEETFAQIIDGDNVLDASKDNKSMTVEGPVLKGSGSTEGLELLDKTVQFKLLESVGNEGQDMDITLDIIVEGKQHKSGADWAEMNKKTVTIKNDEYEVVEESKCNVVIDYTPYFKLREVDGGYFIDGFVDNIDEVIEELGQVEPDFKYSPIIPSEYNGKPVTTIGWHAFSNNQLTSVEIPDSVTSIGGNAFRYNKLTSVEIPNSVTSIGEDAFQRNNLTSAVIPDSVTEIGKEAFDSNKLTSVKIGSSVTSIGSEAFSNNQLTSVKIGSSVTSIGSDAFRANQLTSVVIPDSVIWIGKSAFNNNQLTSVTLGNSVTTIGNWAFSENQLTSVEIPDSVTSIGGNAFRYNKLTSVVIPDSVASIGAQAFNDNKLPDSQAFIYKSNVAGSAGKSIIVSYGGANKDPVIPDSVTEIGYDAFRGSQLTSVEIPDSVTKIGSGAFAYNELTSVVIPDSVTEIGYDAFRGSQLTSVKIGSSVTSIGSRAFDDNQLTSVVIPDSVTEIEYDAFGGNQLTSVVIPNSVTKIGRRAFHSNPGGAVYANELDGDSWPTLRGYEFSSFGSSWSLKPLSEYKP